jgi:hypothetical protein
MTLSLGNGNNAVAFLVSAGLFYNAIAKACSSPQTAEINIGSREQTLMKWVNIGTVEGAVMVGIAMALEKDTRGAVLLGGLTAGIITYGEYIYARRSGLRNGGPATEQAPAGGAARGLAWG